MTYTVEQFRAVRERVNNSAAGKLFWATHNALESKVGESTGAVQAMLKVEIEYWESIEKEFGALAERKVTA